MTLLRGQTVKLHQKTIAGHDPFNAETYVEEVIDVENILITPNEDANDINSDIQLYGKIFKYVLHIPKGNENDWENTIVEFWGKRWKTYGNVVYYQEELVPGEWNGKIKVDLDE